MLRRLVAVPVTAIGLGLAVTAGFSDPVPLEPQPGQDAIAHWEGYPFVPGDIGDTINKRLPSNFRKDGRMVVDLYRDAPSHTNYGVATYRVHGDNELEATITCSDRNELDLAYRLTEAQFAGRTFLKHVAIQSTKSGDLAQRTCSSGQLTAKSLQAFAHPDSL